ncbi:MAG: hypothetical protein HUN04_08320 [Desulfobacter sp.]|nr:MAG: hypothetical protein HUN04_08320 [Desulfobacter sp.]
MENSRKTPKLIWLLQSNQVTPNLYEYLKLLRTRMAHLLDLVFMIPDTSADIPEKIPELDPVSFKVGRRSTSHNYDAFKVKRGILEKGRFTHGLNFADTLLLDDFSGGGVIQTSLDLDPPEGTVGIILQIPHPLGSSEAEERVFHAAVNWAAASKLPSIGYELLPLDTRWHLAPSLPDGVITRTKESFDQMTRVLGHTNIWCLPLYESSIFTSVATAFNLNGAKAAYHYKSTLKIPEARTVLYLPHNVAMIYEYQELLRIIAPLGKEIHLMFAYGADQVRGAYTQQEMVETIYRKELDRFAGFSFHDLNAPWEMMAADALLSCSACFQTVIAQEKNIPSIIYDPMLPPESLGFKQRFNGAEPVRNALEALILEKKIKKEFGTIFMEVARSMTANG